ncbi:MAG: heavy metal translocating P-type ATPase [Pseudomonadota bacterium]
MSCCAATVSSPEFAETNASVQAKLEEKRILASSVKLADDRFKTEFIVPEIHCAACISTIERGLSEFPFIQQVRVNLSLKSVCVIWNRKEGEIAAVPQRLTALGFESHLRDPSDQSEGQDSKSKSLLLALAVAGFAAANIMLLSVSVWSGADPESAQLFHLISGLIAVPAVAFSGQPFFRSAIKVLAAKRLNMDVPISLAVLLALGMSLYESVSGGAEAYFDASVTLLFFLLIGRYLDSMMRQKARGAVARLASLSSKSGIVISSNGDASYVALADIKPGMVMRVFPGERFPVDGKIIRGDTNLDCSHVTGESEPRNAANGSAVEAGSLNLSSVVDFEATSDASASFLGEMRKMIEQAESGRSTYVRIADRMAQIYAPAVHLLALLAFAGWMAVTGGDWHTSVYIAISVLIVTCPCALGLAVPVAHVIGANRLMQNGILMRDGTGLERLAEASRAVFDKTGTLTIGSPTVQSASHVVESELSLIKAMAQCSTHPNSKALSKYLEDVEPLELAETREIPGYGVECVHDGKLLRLGRQEWVGEIASLSASETESSSLSFAVEGRPITNFKITDALRKGAKEAAAKLIRDGMKIEILSGDHADIVQGIAKSLSISCYFARQTPSDKVERVSRLQSSGEKVLMIGDGINDAPALARGNVSIVPASASDVGRQAADFVFIRQSLMAIPIAFTIAKFTSKIVRQNFGLAIAYNCIAVPLAMSGMVTPLIAAIAMSASSVLVVANSFRINFAGKTDAHTSEERVLEGNQQYALGARLT